MECSDLEKEHTVDEVVTRPALFRPQWQALI
jgi:hypothetical protein